MNRSANRVGLDIGSSYIKMLEVSGPRQAPSLVSFGIKKIDSPSAESTISALKAIADELKITVKGVNVSLTGSSVVARVISTPEVKPDELKSIIRLELEKSIPFDINECVFDLYVQSKVAKEKSGLNVVVASAKREAILARIKIVEDAGFSVNVIDIDSFAVANAYLQNFASIDKTKTIALLNVGAKYTNLIILTGDLISFVRDLAIGVDDLEPGKAAGPGRATASLASLTNEIKLSFGYYEDQSGKSVDGIYVSGGGASMAGLGEALSESFGIKPELWNPLQFVNIDPAKINVDEIVRVNGSFAVSAGLALRSA